jgi:flavorubredoxin
MSRDIFQVYLGPNTLTSEEAGKILDKLNSLNSSAEIMGVLGTYGGQKVFGNRIAQRIFNTKAQIGKFQSLNQVAAMPGIGYKRFNAILSALAEHA